MPAKALIIPAAGSGRRLQHKTAKPFIRLRGKTILERTIYRFIELKNLREVIVATSKAYKNQTIDILKTTLGDRISWQCVRGGTERQQSVYEGLKAVGACDLVMVHDAVRPFVRMANIETCCESATQTGAAILGMPSKDTIKQVDENNFVERTLNRHQLWQVQTPQIFRTGLLLRAHRKAARDKYFGTDDASLVEWMGESVHMTRGTPENIKITYPFDLELARLLIDREAHE